MSSKSAADKLLPPLKFEDVFKRSKGRVAKFKPLKTLSSREKASGIAKGRSEVLIKFDKASTGIRTSGHLKLACDYIMRHGEIDAMNQNGEFLNRDEAMQRMEQWVTDQEIPLDKEDRSRPADARRCIISCPPGSDPSAVNAAAFKLGQEIFAAQGFEFVMVVHYRDEKHPKEPEHPHVHLLIKAVNADGRRLNIRKADLRYMRERFAVIAKDYGLNLNATSRSVRGKTAKAKTQAQFHEEKRRQSQAQKWAIDRKKKEFAKSKLHPYEKERRDELVNALKNGKDLTDHPVLTRAKHTRQQVMKNMDEYINELKKGNAEDQALALELEKKIKSMGTVESVQQQKLRIAKRKAAEKFKQKQQAQGKEKTKQSQAQKWAIDRKKKQLEKGKDR